MAREPGKRGGEAPIPETGTKAAEEEEPAFSEAALRYLKMRGRKRG